MYGVRIFIENTINVETSIIPIAIIIGVVIISLPLFEFDFLMVFTSLNF